MTRLLLSPNVVIGYLCLLLHAISVHSHSTSGTHVISLDDGNWEDHIPIKGKEFIVNFFAPWCGQCKLLAPTWAALALEFHDAGVNIGVGQLDCTLNPDISHDIKAYPTIRFYRNGQIIGSYNGERTIIAISQWAAELSTNEKEKKKLLNIKPRSITNNDNKISISKSKDSEDDHDKETDKEFSLTFDYIKFALMRLVSSVLNSPTKLLADHPFVFSLLIYMFGVLSGVFIGVSFALREKQR